MTQFSAMSGFSSVSKRTPRDWTELDVRGFEPLNRMMTISNLDGLDKVYYEIFVNLNLPSSPTKLALSIQDRLDPALPRHEKTYHIVGYIDQFERHFHRHPYWAELNYEKMGAGDSGRMCFAVPHATQQALLKHYGNQEVF